MKFRCDGSNKNFLLTIQELNVPDTKEKNTQEEAEVKETMEKQNMQDWTTLRIKKSQLKQLDEYKIHQNQSYNDVIKNFLKNPLEQSYGDKNTISKENSDAETIDVEEEEEEDGHI